MIRVLAADDHELMLAALQAALTADGIEVIAEASDGSKVLPLIEQTIPDVVVLDVRMPRRNGLQCLADIRERDLDLKVIMLSGSDDPAVVADALAGGADAYVLKTGCTADDLAALVRRIVDGPGVIYARPGDDRPPDRLTAVGTGTGTTV